MKAGTVALLGLGALAVLYYGKLVTFASDVIVLFKTVNVLDATDFQIVLTFQNPTNATVKILSMAADVQINGNDFGNISSFQELDINPNSQQDGYFTLKVGLLSLPTVINNFINTGVGTYTVTVNGTFNLNGDVLPLNLTQTVNFGG